MAIERPCATRTAKRQLRHELLANRAFRPAAERAAAGAAFCERVLALPEVENASMLACYVSTPEEPATATLLERLATRRCTILLPQLLPDFDLSWGEYLPGALHIARFGISEPTGPGLGVDAVKKVAAMICPGLAADERGHRIGRGGGSYDRAIPRLPYGVLRVVLVYDDELLVAVPADEHDQRMDVVITPTRTLRTARG